MGTAFAVLIFLMLLTLVLGPLSKLLTDNGAEVPKQELTDEARDKALAATLAVSIALTEENTESVSRDPSVEPHNEESKAHNSDS